MELLPHQKECVEKFANVRARLVGDSMGVGKTVEGIGLDLDLRARHGKANAHIRTLIICTKTGLEVWRRHLVDMGVDSKSILVINPKNRAPFEKELAAGAHKFDYYVVHWDVLAKLEDINKGTKTAPHILWHHVIADEVHMAKNRQSARTRELKKIKAAVKTGLSGTPADNKPQDLWSVLNWLYPQAYSSYWKFFNTYLEWNDYTGYREVTGVKNLDRLKKEMEPFYIRRTLYDVREDMPKKSYSTITVELTPKMRKTYDNMVEMSLTHLGQDEDILLASNAIAVLTRLQQLVAGTCDIDWDTFYVDYEKYEVKHEEWQKAHDKWVEEGSKKDEEPPEPKQPGMKLFISDPSPKVDAVMEIIETAVFEEDESIVVFTNYNEVAKLVKARCEKKKIPVSSVTGEDARQDQRDKAVSSFQSGATKVFVGTIGAAGTTITLNRAHTAIFVDRHWNPSKNAQAEDRIFRIDNDESPVQIIDIVAADTVDCEKIEKIGTKAKWLRQMLGG